MPNAIDGKSYSKEYKGDDDAGKDALCVQRSAASPGKRVVLIDDLVATGGTLLAGVDLVKGLVSRHWDVTVRLKKCSLCIERVTMKGGPMTFDPRAFSAGSYHPG